jgi:hypothetical protein
MDSYTYVLSVKDTSRCVWSSEQEHLLEPPTHTQAEN